MKDFFKFVTAVWLGIWINILAEAHDAEEEYQERKNNINNN